MAERGFAVACLSATVLGGGSAKAKHVDYYLSLNSPWAYLGSKRFEAIAERL
jgi:hypothetical protein